MAQPPAGGQEGGEAAKQGACQHIGGQCTDKGARGADPDGPEWQQPGPGRCQTSQIRPKKNWARAHGGDTVTGGKGMVDLCLPVLAEPGRQRQQLGRSVDLFLEGPGFPMGTGGWRGSAPGSPAR